MKYIYGEIYDSTNRILFSSEDNSHFFCFMPGYHTKNGIDVISIPSKDKLIFGRTFDNRQIAIYTGVDNIEFAIGQGFHTSVYILSQQSLPVQQFHEFDAISFYGGTIILIY